MLNVKALTELLSKNSDGRLCKKWFLMTPNGTLLAYNLPADIRSLRRQVAVVALAWQELRTGLMERPAVTDDDDDGGGSKRSTQLHTLTMESEVANVIIRQLQPRLLLVLEGGVPPRKRAVVAHVTAEGPDGEVLSSRCEQSAESGVNSSSSSVAESSQSNAAVTALSIHRKKLDGMAAAITDEFNRTGFKMPEETVNRYF